MKFKNLLLLSIVILITVGIFFSCQEEEVQIKGEIAFNIGKLTQTNLKSLNDLDSADHVLVTITDESGNATDYTLYKLELFKFGDDYITEKIALIVGNYQVTEFYVLDKDNNVIYASPMELSVLAQNVDDPLPIDFVITANVSSTLEIEVLSTENLTPEDFGLVSFHLLEVETFQFLVSVSELGSNQLLAAELKISNGSYVYIQNLDSIINNIVTIKDGFDEYIIEINEPGYETYIDTITNTALKSNESTPLVIELIPVDNNTVTDIDGNIYQTVQIGDQIWMAENLKTTKYNDGTAIALVSDNTEWSNLTTGAYCWYNNDEASYKETYGALYNWHTVNTGNLCPTGWHVPTDAEWASLITYLGGESIAGGKLKETGTTHWASPNSGATNEVGFTALPGGYRHYSGSFNYIDNYGYWWSTNENDAVSAWFRNMSFDYIGAFKSSSSKKNGFSIRCVRD